MPARSWRGRRPSRPSTGAPTIGRGCCWTSLASRRRSPDGIAPVAVTGREGARASARVALRSASKVAWRRTEVLRLAARYHWLLGHHRRARRLLERSIAEGERSRRPARNGPDFCGGRSPAAPGRAKGRSFHGLDGDACVARARAAFESLGFTHDLERLRSSDAHLPSGWAVPPS